MAGGGLMEFVRFGCQQNIRLFEEFTINQFEKMLSVNPNYNMYAKDDKGNTYLHEVCETTLWWAPILCRII